MMTISKKILTFLRKTVECYIPTFTLIVLLISFLIGIVGRYVIKEPQTWTYELSSIAFLYAVTLAISTAQSTKTHIVFDLFYEKRSPKTQQIYRIISDVLVLGTAAILTPISLRFTLSLAGMRMQIMQWIPRWILFAPFPVAFLFSSVSALVELIRELAQLKRKKTTNNESMRKAAR